MVRPIRRTVESWFPLVRMGLGALRNRLGGRAAPLNVMISLTDACTSDCGYCAIPQRNHPALSTSRLREIIDELADLGACRVGFWGGEPLLRDDLGELIQHARSRGLWVSAVSNGDLVPRHIDRIRDLDHLILSLDGAAAAHDQQRAPGSHGRVLAALRAARDAGIPAWTLTVLTRHNLDDVPYLVDLAEARGHKAAFQVLHHAEALDGGQGQALHPPRQALRDRLTWLAQAKRRGRPVANSLWQLQQLLGWPDLHTPDPVHDPTAPPCLGGRLFFNVDTAGSVYPCSLLIGRPNAPTVAEGSVADALASVQAPACNRCAATAFTEYNALLRLQPEVMAAWARSIVG